ncbi:MAG: hypothetical protein IPJ78_09685 [Gemmatimonadetes bacterium]|nr:hypothetical protein [Gemmatimonadota bacterium]MBP7548890.1 hypothetical protein [Gemmatimonadaceae bacterium]
MDHSPFRRRLIGALCLLPLVGGCLYGFAGGGLPPHVRTVAVLPFENETSSPELPLEMQAAMRQGLQSRLGLRDAPEDRANAVVRGRITRFELDAAAGFSANPNQSTSARRRLRVQVDVEIVDQVTGKVLWTRTGMQADGEYSDRGEAQGRKQAIDRIVNDVIEGAQSQW